MLRNSKNSNSVSPPKTGSQKFARLPKFPIHNMTGNENRNQFIMKMKEKKSYRQKFNIKVTINLLKSVYRNLS